MPVAERISARPAGIDGERPEHPPRAALRGRVDDEAAGEALRRAEAIGPDLMADRARHAIGGEPVVFGSRPAPNRQVREDLAVAGRPASPWSRTWACGRSSIRPRSRAPPLGWSIVSRRTAACQYGSRAEFAIIDARHDTPIDTSSPVGVVSPLWHATQSCDVRNTRRVAVGRRPARMRAASPCAACCACGSRERARPRRRWQQRRRPRWFVPSPHRQPSSRPPSNQSHRK